MPRNYAREREYERENYRQLLFKIKVDEADRHKEHLKKHNLKPVEWLRYAMSLRLVPGAAANTCGSDAIVPDIRDATEVDNVVNMLGLTVANTDISGKTVYEHVISSLAMSNTDIREIDTDISANSDDACEGVPDMQIMESTAAWSDNVHDAVALSPDTAPVQGDDARDEVEVSAVESALTGVQDGGRPVKKKLMPRPTAEMVVEWARLYGEGLSFPQIAKGTGYEVSTVRKRVRKYENDVVLLRSDEL